MTPFRVAGSVAVALATPWSWVAPAHAEAQVTPVQIDRRVENVVRVAIHYDAGIYDGSCALTVTADWTNLDTGASGSGDVTAISTIDGHYGFIGYGNTTFATGGGTVVVTLSSHPGAELRITT